MSGWVFLSVLSMDNCHFFFIAEAHHDRSVYIRVVASSCDAETKVAITCWTGDQGLACAAPICT